MASHFKKIHLAKFEIPTAVVLNIFKFCGELHQVCRYLTDVSGERCALMFREKEGPPHEDLTLRLLMSYIYIYGAPSKARNANVVYIWTYVWQR